MTKNNNLANQHYLPRSAGSVYWWQFLFIMANAKTRKKLAPKGPPQNPEPTPQSRYIRRLEKALREAINQVEYSARNEHNLVSERDLELQSEWKDLLRS